MEVTRDKILEVLYESIDELNEQRRGGEQLTRTRETRFLLGHEAGLDSLGFVNLVALIEEKCQARFGRDLVLSDAAGGTAVRDPFETVDSLAEFIELSLTGRVAYWR